jgi:hypothetical protein
MDLQKYKKPKKEVTSIKDLSLLNDDEKNEHFDSLAQYYSNRDDDKEIIRCPVCTSDLSNLSIIEVHFHLKKCQPYLENYLNKTFSIPTTSQTSQPVEQIQPPPKFQKVTKEKKVPVQTSSTPEYSQNCFFKIKLHLQDKIFDKPTSLILVTPKKNYRICTHQHLKDNDLVQKILDDYKNYDDGKIDKAETDEEKAKKLKCAYQHCREGKNANNNPSPAFVTGKFHADAKGYVKKKSDSKIGQITLFNFCSLKHMLSGISLKSEKNLSDTLKANATIEGE